MDKTKLDDLERNVVSYFAGKLCRDQDGRLHDVDAVSCARKVIAIVQAAIGKRANPAIPEDVRDNIEWMIEPYYDKGAPVPSREGLARANSLRDWLASQPVAGDKAVCAACGKIGKTPGEVIDSKNPNIALPICVPCCAMWDDVDTKDDVWAAICVRRNSGAYVPSIPPREPKVTT